MERSARTQRTLSKQTEIDEDDFIDPKLCPKNVEEEITDNENSTNVTNQPIHKSRSQSKVKLLVRSHAVREETSPPPDLSSHTLSTTTINNNDINSSNNNHPGNCLTVPATCPKLKTDFPQGNPDSHCISLSRGNSTEQYSDASGIDVEEFIVETMNKNSKDRALLLKIESELTTLMKDQRRIFHRFPPMSSYHRMLIHRVAAYFGFDHHVEGSGHQVVVTKLKSTRMPDTKLSQFIRDDSLLTEEPKKSILKRDSSSFDETSTFNSQDGPLKLGADCRSKSFEEREEEYEKVRNRIFNKEQVREKMSSSPQPDLQDEETVDFLDIQPSQNTCEDSHINRKQRMQKVESYESSDTLRANSLRSSISKSNSFGGYDQETATGNKILTKQGSGSSVSSRLSPSSSGYKSQSLRSDINLSNTPSPSVTPHLFTQLSSQSSITSPDIASEMPVVWAVTNIDKVPLGSVIINPETGKPFTNSDGSVYRFDPKSYQKKNSSEEDQPQTSRVHSPLVQTQNDAENISMVRNFDNMTPPSTEVNQNVVPSDMFGQTSSYDTSSENETQVQGTSKKKNFSTKIYVSYKKSPRPVRPPPCKLNVFDSGTKETMFAANHQQPLVYSKRNSTPLPMSVQPNYDQRVNPEFQQAGRDFSNYYMGLNVPESVQPPVDNTFYWHLNHHSAVPPPPPPQVQNQSQPIFYAGASNIVPPNHNVASCQPVVNTPAPPALFPVDSTGGMCPTLPNEWNQHVYSQPQLPPPMQPFYNTPCMNINYNSVPTASNFNNGNTGPNPVLLQQYPQTPSTNCVYNTGIATSGNQMNARLSPPDVRNIPSYAYSTAPNSNIPERPANTSSHSNPQMPFYVSTILTGIHDLHFMGSNNQILTIPPRPSHHVCSRNRITLLGSYVNQTGAPYHPPPNQQNNPGGFPNSGFGN